MRAKVRRQFLPWRTGSSASWSSRLTVRGTQSLVHICAFCWKRPGLLAWELLWRWGFGIPARRSSISRRAVIAASVSLNQESLSNLSLSDPLGAGQQLTAAAAALTPPCAQQLYGWGPLLAVAWAIASGLGRNAVLQRLDPALRPCSLDSRSAATTAHRGPGRRLRGLVPRHRLGRGLRPSVAPLPTWSLGVHG